MPDATAVMDQGLAVAMGLSLAATCGLRAFLPLFLLGALGLTGRVELGEGFRWMASWPALACFGSATVAELAADKFPVVDHALDVLGTVVRPVAGTIAVAGVVSSFDPLAATVLGLLTGGVAAGGVHLAKAKLRLASSALTGAVANPVLSVLEDIAAAVMAVLSWLFPLLVLSVLLAVVVGLAAWWRRRRRRRLAGGPAGSA